MTHRPFLRALMMGAALVLAVLACIWVYRAMQKDPAPEAVADFDPADFVQPRGQLDAPFVASDYEVVDAMLAMAEVRPDDYVIDLGSGDGRILIAAARSHGARGLGIDIDPARITESTANAQAARLSDRVQFRRQDLFETPLGDADVLTLYLTQEVNVRLRPRILSQMRPGARVVSHDFDMGEWRPDERQRIGTSNIYLWRVPAQVEGRWTIDTGTSEAVMELEQNFQELEGTISYPGGSARVEQGRVEGRRIRFIGDAGDGRKEYEGRVDGDRMVPLRRNGGWSAVRAG